MTLAKVDSEQQAEIDRLYLELGYITGAIGVPWKRARLVAAIQAEPMGSYVRYLRDQLTKVLEESEVE